MSRVALDVVPGTSQVPIRFIAAASLFDGHDASINIMRRMLQASGAEVIHLGHNRSVAEIVSAAIQEDVQGIAISSYQGGHVEYFKFMIDCLRSRGAGHVQVFGGGGSVIVPEEIQELQAYGVARIYSPQDGQSMGLQGMIDHMINHAAQCWQEHEAANPVAATRLFSSSRSAFGLDAHAELAQLITHIENDKLSPTLPDASGLWQCASALVRMSVARS